MDADADADAEAEEQAEAAVDTAAGAIALALASMTALQPRLQSCINGPCGHMQCLRHRPCSPPGSPSLRGVRGLGSEVREQE